MRPLAFSYEQLPARVVFGPGTRARVPALVDELEDRGVFLVVDRAARETGDELAAALGARLAARWNEAVQHVPVELADRARTAFDASGAGMVVCVGGGSSTGLAKAIALSHHVPVLAVPTTYAGSEQTTIYGLTGGRHKQTGKHHDVLPKVVVYDPELTLGLPPAVTGPSAFNALAHSVEALYAPGHNPVTSALALEGVRAIHHALPIVMAAPGDLPARSELLFGAYLSGGALGATAAAMHHKICHVLGGMFDLVHADTHSVILPHAVAFLGPALPEEMARLADALGVPGGDPAAALWDLAVASRVPTTLAALAHQGAGLGRDDLPEAAARCAAEITTAPRRVSEADILALLERAYDGERPTIDRG